VHQLAVPARLRARVLEQQALLVEQGEALPVAPRRGHRERAVARAVDQARLAREAEDEAQDVVARELAAGVGDQVLEDALLGGLEDLAAHGEAHAVLGHVGEEARDVRGQVDAGRELLVRPVRVAGHGHAAQPGQRDLVEHDQRLVLQRDAVAAEIEVAHGAHERLLEDQAPAARVPVQELRVRALEERTREQAAELEDRLLDEVTQPVREPRDARGAGRLLRVHLVELAQPPRGQRAALARGVERVEMPAQREHAEDARGSLAAVLEQAVAQLEREPEHALAEALDAPVVARDDEPAPRERRDAGVELVGRELLEPGRGGELLPALLVARRGGQAVHHLRQALPEPGHALRDARRIGHPHHEASAQLVLVGRRVERLLAPEAVELDQVAAPPSREPFGQREAASSAVRACRAVGRGLASAPGAAVLRIVDLLHGAPPFSSEASMIS
jgi:hypothetical protein